MKSNVALFWLALVQAVWVEARRAQVKDLGTLVGNEGDATEDISINASSEANSIIEASGDHTKTHEHLSVSAQQLSGTDLFKSAKHNRLDLCEGEYIGFPASTGRVDNVCRECKDPDCKCYIFEPDMHSFGPVRAYSQNHVQRALQCKGKAGDIGPWGGDCKAQTGVMKKVTPCQIRAITCYFKCLSVGNDVEYKTFDPDLKEDIMEGSATDRCNAYIPGACRVMYSYSKVRAPVLLKQDETYLVGKTDMDNMRKWKKPLAREMSQKIRAILEAAARAQNQESAEGELDDNISASTLEAINQLVE